MHRNSQTLNLLHDTKYKQLQLIRVVVPYRKIAEAGYEPVIANPNGDTPVIDANSNNAMFFGGDDKAREEALQYAKGIKQLERPKTLASYALEAYSDALRNEVRSFGIDVIVVEPGAIESEWSGIAADEAERYSGLGVYGGLVAKFRTISWRRSRRSSIAYATLFVRSPV